MALGSVFYLDTDVRMRQTHGPLPISRYMTLCLSHPTLGYYTTKSVFGADGDFITSPEISQIFGEVSCLFWVVLPVLIDVPSLIFKGLGFSFSPFGMSRNGLSRELHDGSEL